jgi:hypothetical protein
VPLISAEKTLLRLICPSCNQATDPRPVAWLSHQVGMPRSSCRKSIDLLVGDNGVLIRETAFNCERIDSDLRREGKK